MMTRSMTSMVLLLVFLCSGCDSENPAQDAGTDADDADGDQSDTGPRCAADSECDDLLFCNGSERCDPTSPEADDFGCRAGTPVDCDDGLVSTTDSCSETRGACLHTCPDLDADGHADASCVDEQGDPLGDDCDDLDPQRYPGNGEVCDEADHDEDCDLTTVGDTDADDDGFVTAACCNDDGTTTICGPDCDDDNPDINPNSTEFCDVELIDEDCDGLANEGLMVTCYLDEDDDGFAAADTPPVAECKVPGRDHVSYCPEHRTDLAPTELASTDCDDTRPDIHPGAEEICDRLDDDCDGLLAAIPGVLDETDRDGDGYVECRPVDLSDYDCADDDDRAFPGQSSFFTTPISAPLVPVERDFDFDCNGVEELEFFSAGGCDPLTGCRLSLGWAGATPACGETERFVTSCGPIASACLPLGLEDRTSSCR